MMRRRLTTIAFLTCCLLLLASAARASAADEIEEKSLARWQKILDLKNSSQTDELAAEAEVQMDWFRRHGQWDHYYRTWQLKINTLCSKGNLQMALQETQQMLADAKERDSRLGHALAYKQIGIIYLNMKQTGPAVDALQRYADLMKDQEDDYSSLSNIYYRMAKAYDYDKAYSQELRVTDEWRKFLDEKVGFAQDRADVKECYNACYLARAASFIGLEQLDDARLALDSAGLHAHQVNTAHSLHHFYKMQARYFLAAGDAAKTLLYTDSVSLITDERDDHSDEIRAQALILLGQGVDAARIYQRLYNEKDSLFGHEARQRLDELNTLFQVDELKSEQQRTRFLYTLLTAASIVLGLLLLLIYGWRNAIKQKKANELLRLANERAKVSSRMKTEFIRNISHEIRTPLNIVSGFTQILTSPDMELPDHEKADIQRRVTENTDRITKLVDHMLELSDLSSEVVIERTDQMTLHELVEQSVRHSRIASYTRPGNAQSAVTFESLEADAPAAALPLLTNRKYAVRSLAQLLENAVKFTPEGSIVLRAETTDDEVLITVEDTGLSIPADQTERIFTEFVQLDEFTDGTGIGLTIARSLVRRMGGDLWLDTEYSQGARFVMKLLRN